MPNKPIATLGCLVSYGPDADNLVGLYSCTGLPQIKGQPSQVDATTMYGDTNEYIPGKRENPLKDYPCNRGGYGPKGAKPSELVDEYGRAIADSSDTELQLIHTEYQDGSYHEYWGYISTGDDSADVNDKNTWHLYVTPSSDLAYTNAEGVTIIEGSSWTNSNPNP